MVYQYLVLTRWIPKIFENINKHYSKGSKNSCKYHHQQ